MLFRLLYKARATYPPYTFHDLDILRSAIEFNGANDVTGFLIRSEHAYFQVLEGQQDIVINLAERISRDGRIYDYKELWSSEIKARMFGLWAMGYHMLTSHDNGLPHRLNQLSMHSAPSIKQQTIHELAQLALDKYTGSYSTQR